MARKGAGKNRKSRRRNRKMKQMICTVAGLFGSTVAAVFGGWDSGLATLVIL